jgi:hypothetical protein
LKNIEISGISAFVPHLSREHPQEICGISQGCFVPASGTPNKIKITQSMLLCNTKAALKLILSRDAALKIGFGSYERP